MGLGRQGINPLLGDVFAVEYGFKSLGGRPRVRLRSVDNDDDLADFHDLSKQRF
jgi:hypothetical protein